MVVVLATALAVAPAAAFATNSFTDVEPSDFFHDAVDWAKTNGVTVGCNPPDNTRFCPDDPVTRGQMAVFLERLDSENVFLRPGDVSMSDGGGDADTLDGKDSTDFLLKTGKAADADKLDGMDSSAFLGTTDKAADADKLDGIEAGGFARHLGTLPLATDEIDVGWNDGGFPNIAMGSFTVPDDCGDGTTSHDIAVDLTVMSLQRGAGTGSAQTQMTVRVDGADTGWDLIVSVSGQIDTRHSQVRAVVTGLAPGEYPVVLDVVGKAVTRDDNADDYRDIHLAQRSGTATSLGFTCG